MGLRPIQFCVLRKTCRQVWIGDEELSKRNSIGLAFIEQLLSCPLVDRLVGNEDSAKDSLEVGADAVWTDMLACGDKSEPALA